MITTITLNPAVDEIYVFDEFSLNKTNRVVDIRSNTGGKGINVAKICKVFCEDVRATGFLGGEKGKFIKCGLMGAGIIDEFIDIREDIRKCICLYDGNNVTEIIEQGPHIYNDENKTFLNLYSKLLDLSSVICASGSLPRGVAKNTYCSLIEKANKRKVKFLLDTEGEYLKYAIEAKPYFIKVSIKDLQYITNVQCTNELEIIEALKSIKNVQFKIVSLEQNGAIAQYGDKVYKITIPKFNNVKWLGTGDGLVAGITVATVRNYDIEETLRYGVAAAIANGKEEFSCNIDMNFFDEVKEQIIIEVV